MSTVEVFSDISKMACGTGYCYIIRRGGRREVVRAGKFTDHLETTAAEIATLAIALESLPPTPHVIAWSDIADLDVMVAKGAAAPLRRKICDYLDLLRTAMGKHGKVSIGNVPRHHEDYRECDQYARAAAEYPL